MVYLNPFTRIRNNILSKFEFISGKENVLSSIEDRICYSYDATRQEYLPDLVVIPGSREEISEILKLANYYKIPVVVRGSGTGLSGGALAVRGGIVLVTTKLNKILDIDEKNLYVVVEPGVITGNLHNTVENLGFFYPPDPSSLKVSTIGGNISHNAGGPRALKYGVTRDYVRALELVLPDGNVLNSGSKTVKSVTGYDLTRLIVGSEGTLAIITKAILKLIPKPEKTITFLSSYKDLEIAAEAVVEMARKKLIPSTIEIMDETTISAVKDFVPGIIPEGAESILLIEIDGYEDEAKRQEEILLKILHHSNAEEILKAENDMEREKLWTARRSALSALSRIKPSTIIEDATVPVDKVPDLIRGIQELSKKYLLTIGTFGHAGDGNLHPTLLTDMRIGLEKEKVEKVTHEIFNRALSLGGTLSGEHGIGIMKSKFLKMEVKDEGYRIMKGIKKLFDPNNILNPGKIFEDD
ncbi:MAG: FAD-linked oxidase C-terminal domain-containing protein [Acidobacteriota bacterium]